VNGRGVVVVGGYVNALGVVRALAARGIPTAVVTNQPFDIAHLSRWVCAHERIDGIGERPELLVELLERRAVDWDGWAMLPTNDESLAALAANHDRLSSRYRLIAPPLDVARHLLDKTLMLEAASAAGADRPINYGPATEETAARSDLEFPLVIKPLVGYRFAARFGAKLFVAQHRDELRRYIALVAAAQIDAQVIELVPGPDSAIYQYTTYVDARGEPWGGLTARKLRQGPPGFGVARVAEIVPDPDGVEEMTVALARRIGLRGIASAEYKRDARDGRLRFLELNGRSVVYNALLRRAGLDLAWLAWSDHVAGRPEHARPSGWPGVWINLHADVLYSALFRNSARPGLAEFLGPYRRPKLEAVWSTRDPRPFVAQWTRTARAGLGAIAKREPGGLVADRSRPRS